MPRSLTDLLRGLLSSAREARRVAGTPEHDAARFVAQARTLQQDSESPSVVANVGAAWGTCGAAQGNLADALRLRLPFSQDFCDIMGESVGSSHVNTCDEWREEARIPGCELSSLNCL